MKDPKQLRRVIRAAIFDFIVVVILYALLTGYLAGLGSG